MNPDLLLTDCLRALPSGAAVTRILGAALDAVDPAAAVHRHLGRDGDLLRAGDQTYDLRSTSACLSSAPARPARRWPALPPRSWATDWLVVWWW